MFGATAIAKTGKNIIGIEKALLLGQQGAVIVGLVVGGLIVVVIVIASSWMIATRAVSETAMPLEPSPRNLYVERDVYGRGTIFDINSVDILDPSRGA